MILDKRILKGKTYLDCFDTEEAKQFIGKKCYFTRDLSRFENLDGPGVYKVTLTDISDHYEVCYGSDELGIQQWDYARFIIPCEWVKEAIEKKYRPYKDVEEFFDDVGCTLGDVIRFRKRDTTEEEYHTLLTGFKGNARVNIGLGDGGYYSLSDLFSLFELYTADGWRPFGTEE